MTNRFLILLLSITTCLTSRAQTQPTPQTPPPAQPLPTPEEFVNQIQHNAVDSSADHYYLITGADTCRFTKYDYEEWSKYYLYEPVPFLSLNELSEKAYLSRYPYYWKQDRLDKAICITVKKADTLLFPERYTSPSPPKTSSTKKRNPKPAQSQTWVLSFSLPQFTDDGHYAVIDLNSICGASCGTSLTCIFKHTSAGWKLIGRHVNYTSAR
ncbi:MAG: hypothetical protein JST68_03130 [Bacteroidetes bacterium]|nr:hypothetical protein [Bacteroidota bacterium]